MVRLTITLPDDLAARLDERAQARGASAEDLVRDLVNREVAAARVAGPHGGPGRIVEILAAASSHGGDAARLVREERAAR